MKESQYLGASLRRVNRLYTSVLVSYYISLNIIIILLVHTRLLETKIEIVPVKLSETR